MKEIIKKLIDNYPQLTECVPEIEEAYRVLKNCFDHGGKVLLCGNGGSASDCEHIVGELMKGFKRKRIIDQPLGDELVRNLQGALPAVSLPGQTALATACLNDMNADYVYAQQLYGLGRPGDVMIGISTSGNSENVKNAAVVAGRVGIKVIAMTGRKGGSLVDLSDTAIKVPADETDRVQEYHLPVYHAICEMLESAYWNE